MAAFSPCQSFWVNCQICCCWGSFLRRARDVDFHKHLITWPNWTTGRAGDICREVNHYQVHWEIHYQEKSIAIGRNLGWKVHRLSQSHEVREVFCWSAMAGEREVPTHSYFAWWQLKSPYTRKRELGWVVKSLTCYFAAQLEKRWT